MRFHRFHPIACFVPQIRPFALLALAVALARPSGAATAVTGGLPPASSLAPFQASLPSVSDGGSEALPPPPPPPKRPVLVGPLLGKGDRLDELNTGREVYRKVVIQSVNARTVRFTHEGGVASLTLRNLPEPLRSRLGYTQEAEAAAEKVLAENRARSDARRLADQQRLNAARQQQLIQRYEKLMQKDFLQPAVLREELDLRPKFFANDLAVKSQGSRPSCAVFAVLGALELLNAEVAGKSERLSEEYVVWATRRLMQRDSKAYAFAVQGNDEREDEEADRLRDAGFSLEEVVMAVRAFGVPLQSSMPNTFGIKMSEIQDPPKAVIDEARARRKVFIHAFPGRENPIVLSNIVHALNAGIPVPVGLRWPHPYTLRRGFLSEQQPVNGYAHAVTLVGYRCPTGNLADAQFIFRNSYGNEWGQGGHGIVTAHYLFRHMISAALVELQDRDTASR